MVSSTGMVYGSGQSYDGPLYYKSDRLPWYVEAPLLLLGYGAGFGTVIAGLFLIVAALKHWPLETVIALVVGYFSIALWARWKWR